jgi:hypothetical protein
MSQPASPDLGGTYSPRVRCPGCESYVRLEDVKVAGSFRCPSCGRALRVSVGYQRGIALASMAIAFPVIYVLVLKTWWAVVLWFPISFLIGIPLTVVSKFVAPPRLERDVSNYSGPLGLGSD